MENMDSLCERLAALEHQIQVLSRQAHLVERRLRWRRGFAGGVLALSLLSLPPPWRTAQDTLEQRVAALEDKFVALTFDAGANELVITGANLRIVNGLGTTDCTDERSVPIPDCYSHGLGNLIVGYNEPRYEGGDNRTGSHNVVVGRAHNFSSFGGMVVGIFNEISGKFAAVSRGNVNTASGFNSAVHGGLGNTASGFQAAVSGGQANTASGLRSVVSGGVGNNAAGNHGAVVSGGHRNTASGDFSTVSGGERTRPVAGMPVSAVGERTRRAATFPRSVAGGRMWPMTRRPQSVAAFRTRPAASARALVGGATSSKRPPTAGRLGQSVPGYPGAFAPCSLSRDRWGGMPA